MQRYMKNIYRERYFSKKKITDMLHRIAVPFKRPFFPNGQEAVENGLVDGLYPLNECKKVFFVAKQFSYPLLLPHQPHDAVFEVGHIVVGFISLYCMFRRPRVPATRYRHPPAHPCGR